MSTQRCSDLAANPRPSQRIVSPCRASWVLPSSPVTNHTPTIPTAPTLLSWTEGTDGPMDPSRARVPWMDYITTQVTPTLLYLHTCLCMYVHRYGNCSTDYSCTIPQVQQVSTVAGPCRDMSPSVPAFKACSVLALVMPSMLLTANRHYLHTRLGIHACMDATVLYI